MNKDAKILIACEESGTVTSEFRALGFYNTFSCDIIPTSCGHPEWHIQGDVTPLLEQDWDLIIAFPPCTYITNAGAVRMRVKGEIVKARYEKAMEAKEFFMQFLNADCPKIAIENPTPMKLIGLPAYNQVIQPYQFGHPYSKRTCLWLKGLPQLMPTEIMTQHEPYVNGGCKDANGNYRKYQGRNERDQKTRSKTFIGIAKAFAK
jgi:hypothetical protein